MKYTIEVKKYIPMSFCGAPVAIGKLQGGGEKYKKGCLSIPLFGICLHEDFDSTLRNRFIATLPFSAVLNVQRFDARRLEIGARPDQTIHELTISGPPETIDAIVGVLRDDSNLPRNKIS